MPHIFPVISEADKAAYTSQTFTATFRYIGTRPPIAATGKYLTKCIGYNGEEVVIEHGTEDFEVTDPRVAKCIEVHIDYFSKELDYLRVS